MKKATILIAAAMLFLVGGCIDFQEELTLSKDGSGTITYLMSLDKTYLARLESLSESTADIEGAAENPADEIPTEEEIRASLKDHPGVKLVEYQRIDTEEAEGWKIKFSFESIAAYHAMEQALDTAARGDDRSTAEPTWSYTKQADGTWLFEQEMNAGEEGEAEAMYPDMDDEDEDDSEYEDEEYEMPDSAEMAQMMEQMQSAMGEYDEQMADSPSDYSDSTMAGGMEAYLALMQEMMAAAAEATVRIAVTFPGKIVESNATKIEGTTAIWEHTGMTMMESGSGKIFARVKQ